MEEAVRFTISIEGTGTRDADGLVPVSGRIHMQLPDGSFDLGIRTLDLTLPELLARSPLMPPDSAEDGFGTWLFADNTPALAAYYAALGSDLSSPPVVVWTCRAPAGVRLPDIPVEATPGHDRVSPAVYREVQELPASDAAISRYSPLVGCWRVQPISLVPRRLLPGRREPTTEYAAIAGRRLPTLDVADIEYALTTETLHQLMNRLRTDAVHVLHLMAECTDEGHLLLQDDAVSPEALVRLLGASGLSELQLIVLSGPGDCEVRCDLAHILMEALPLPAAICYHGRPGFRSCILPFTERFYGSLGSGCDVVEATAHARAAMKEGGRATTPDVLAPVVYARAGKPPPRIVSGDRGIEGILAAAEAIAAAREVFDAPEVWELAETVPTTLAQVHDRLIRIGEEHMSELRRTRETERAVLRDEIRRRPPTYTVSSAVAEQLSKVLDMLPSPAHGHGGSSPTGPPNIYWAGILKRNRTIVQRLTFRRRSGPMTLWNLIPQTPWFQVHRHDGSAPVHVAMLHRGTPSLEDELPTEGSRAVFDVRRWPPTVAATNLINAEDADYMRLIERDIASGAVQVVRTLLRFHFRGLFDTEVPPPSFPRGVTASNILRGGFEAAGISATDVAPEAGLDLPWPAGCHLLEDTDTGRRCLVICKNDPDIDQTRLPRWRAVADYYEHAEAQGAEPCVLYIDVWDVDAVRAWQPQNPLVEPSAPSWVWDQLPEAATEYRYSVLQRLWEWWIGALAPESEHG